MKGPILRASGFLAILILSTAGGIAFQPPASTNHLSDFDARLEKRLEPATSSAPPAAAVVELRARSPKLRVDLDPLTSSPRKVSLHGGFLTAATVPSPGAVAGAAAAAMPANDPVRPLKGFLDGHRDLFGHGAEALNQTRTIRDYVTPHNGMRTMAWQQEVDGIPVFEAILVAHTTRLGELINVSSGFVPDPATAANAGTTNRAALVAGPPLSARAAVAVAARNVGETVIQADVEPVAGVEVGAERQAKFRTLALRGETVTSLVWLPMGRDEIRLCWDVILSSRMRGEMFRVLVDAQTGEVIIRRGLTRYISDASYRVYTSDSPSPFSPGHATPLTTQPPATNRVLVTLTALSTNASPNGWINDGVNETTGNNVDAHTDWNADDLPDLPRPVGSPFRVFDFAMDPTTQDPTSYAPASVTQLFYLCNWYHDRLYELGFTEAAGNFQVDNFGRGGQGSDPVQAEAQDGGGVNNANFSTPPDGFSGRMQMYIFSGPNPRHDGDLDAEIVFHEFTHGLSWRLVGGGQGLGTSQSDGLGEGWSDFYGLSLLSEPGDDVNGCYAAGGYATYQLSGLTANYYFGIRRYPYSTDMAKNPLTFKDIDTFLASPHSGIPRSPVIGNSPAELHNQGEVWCVTLWEARANLVNKLGWATGNQLILQLVTDGMKLTPPSPDFLQARDAILQADLVDTGGANRAELWMAFAKRGMGYSAISPASSGNTGIVEAYDVPDDLVITPPQILISSGSIGGPFSPNPASFILTNSGSTPLSWSLLNTSSWINVQPAAGTLPPGAPAASVEVTVGDLANTFPLGVYTANLVFTNHTSGLSQSCLFRLSIVGGSIFDDFEPDVDLSQWSAFGGVIGSTVLATNTGGSISPPNSLWFGASGSRFATTVPIDASGGGSVSFWLRLGNGLSPWETVDLPVEGIVLEYSVNGGSTWANIVTCDTPAFFDWTQVSNTIPVGARTSNTLFRWRQLSNSGSGYDQWALDDVRIDAGPASTLTLSVPATATEGDAPLTGTVTATPAPAADLTVNLNSSDSSEATVPAAVIISAGNSNATFEVVIQDDAELDGLQSATITATAAAHRSDDAVLTVGDNETATLAVALPASASESAGTVVGTVSVSSPPDAKILVQLASSDTSEIQVPATVLLLSGQTSVAFTVTVVNDNLIDGPQNAVVTAQVPNWTDGVGDITVLDNEPLNLSVSLPASAYENAGVLAAAGGVGISGSLPTNLIVSLQASDLTETTVPATVTILAGQTNAAFDLGMVDDTVVDGAQACLVTASAPGFITASNSMTALDDESPPTPANPFPANLASNVIANTILSWSNGLAGVTNDIYFGTAPGSGELVLLGSTTGTNWTLPLLAPNTIYYWRVVVRRVGSTVGPLWRFTTRGVDHFVWEPITSPKYVNQPFDVAVTAKDQFEMTVSNFTGVVNLTGLSAGLITNKVLGDVVHTETSSGSYTLAFAIIPSKDLTVTHVRSYSGTKVSIWSDTGTLLASQNVSGPNGSWTETPLAAPLQLLAGATYLVSFYTGDTAPYYYRLDRPVTFPDGTLVDGYYYATDDIFPTSFYDADQVIFLCDLRYTVTGAAVVPITPTVTGTFVNGAWAGNLSVLAPTTNLVLRADDGQAHTGLSAPITVELRDDLSLTITDTPDPVAVGADVNYLITVTNVGPAAATGVVVTNLLPATASFVSATLSQGSSVTNGNAVICNLGSIAGNNSATIAIVVRTISVGSITNIATVYRTEVDPLPGNNSAPAITSVQIPALSINSVSVAEGSMGTKPLVFTVSLSAAAITNVSVSFATANGSATAGSDYFATNGTLNFNSGQTSQSFAVQIVGDKTSETNETFTVTLVNATNALITGGIGTGTISDDDNSGIIAYFTDNDPGATGWSSPITNAGFIPLQIEDISTFPLTNIDALVINEHNNSSLSTALLARLAAIQTWVSNGGRLVIHDRSAGNLNPNPFLLGTSDITTVRVETSDIDVVPPGTNLVVNGPRGTIGNSTLDGGNSSAHGYIPQTQMPEGGYPIISMGGDPTNLVCFSYPLGSGLVYYSSIPLDYYLGGGGPLELITALTNIYAPNVLAYVTGEPSGIPAPPSIVMQPTNVTAVAGGSASFMVSALGSHPLGYQWRKGTVALAGATNASLYLSGVQTNDAGNYSVVVTNNYGSRTSSIVALTVIDLAVSDDFRIVALTPNNSAVVDHDFLTGDDRGGIAASSTQVFYSGDDATARFSLADLSGGTGIGRINDGMVSDLRSEQMYHLANGTNLLTDAGTVTSLVELNGTTGLPSGGVIPLSQSIIMNNDSGIFAGYGRVVLHNGMRVYEVLLPSGVVVDRGAMTMPAHVGSENWAFWGVAENYDGLLYLVYVLNSQTIVRTQVPNGVTTDLATFSNLSDMASITVSLARSRWYFHYEGYGQFGGTSETIGYADAAFSVTSDSNPPVIISQPVSQVVSVGDPVSLSVVAAGAATLRYQWSRNGVVIGAATNQAYSLNPVQYSNAGIYSVVVSNASGFANSTDATLTVVPLATNLSFYAFDTGRYDSAGDHNPGNANYAVGDADSTNYRDWFAFNIPLLAGRVTAASLRLNTYGIVTSDAFETYRLRHVNTPVSTLVAGGTGLVSIYNDLGEGVVYGTRDFFPNESNQYLTMTLTADFLTNVMAAAGQAFAIGGEIASLDGDLGTAEYVFGASDGNSTNVQLTLTLAGSPAPLRFWSSEIIGSDAYFWLGTTDGSPIMPDRAAGIQFYSSPDLNPPLTNWSPMTNAVLLTNNLLRLKIPGAVNSSRFIRAQESP